jgi:hypothetical protein
MEEVEVTFTHFCEICGCDIDISKDKYLWEPLKGLKLFWRRLLEAHTDNFPANLTCVIKRFLKY